MTEVSKILEKETLEAVILQAWEWMQVDNCIADQAWLQTMRQEVTELLYNYLDKYKMINDLMPVCKALLEIKDLARFRTRNEYNYNKLLITLKTKRDV